MGQEYVVYCDESRHEGGKNAPFMAIGGLWVPRTDKSSYTRALRALLQQRHLGSEIKWRKASAKRIADYKAVVDFFFEYAPLQYRVIVVEESKVDYEKFHGGDRELGFYKFYFEMLEKWLLDNNQYLILVDYKRNKGADRYSSLRRALERKILGRAWISDLTVVDSAQAPLAQLCDLFTGAVAASWCGFKGKSAKEELAAYIATRLGVRDLKVQSRSPRPEKFNVFRIDLERA